MTANTAPAPAIEPEDYRRLVGFKLLLLAILGVAAYLNSVYGVFLFEDESRILRNPDVHSPGMSPNAWLSPRRTADFTLALNGAVSRDQTWSYHLFNIGFHVLAGLALYGVVCRTLIRQGARPRLQEAAPWLSFLIALLWLVHPLQTESVDYLSRRGDLLAGLFYVVTLYCVIRGADSERGMLWYVAAVLTFALGTGTAWTIVTAPVVVLLYDRIFLAESWRDLCKRRGWLYVGFAACWLLLGASVWRFGYDYQHIGPKALDVSPLGYALAQPGVILHDLGLVFWPLGICVDYFDWPLEQPADAYVLPFIVVGALLAAMVWALVRRPKIGFLGAWFFLTLAPTSSFIPQAQAAGDYRMYLPLGAVAVLVVLAVFALVEWVGERAPWTAYAAVGLALAGIGALGYATFHRNADYENPLTIWEDAAGKRPGDVFARLQIVNIAFQRGELHLKAKDLDKAQVEFDRAAADFRVVLEAPDAARNAEPRAAARNNLGVALLYANRADEALRSIADGPDDAGPRAQRLNDLGFLLLATHKPAEAVPFFQEAARLQPETARYHFNLAQALLDKGDKEGAEIERKKAEALDANGAK